MRYMRKRRGSVYFLTAIFASLIMFIASRGLATVTSSQFSALEASGLAAQTQQYAKSKIYQIEVQSYDNVAAEARQNIAGTNFDEEVVVGAENTLENGSKTKLVTVNIYKSGEANPRFSLPTTLSSLGSGSLPSGSVILWSGYISAIPDGFQLCNGENGSPDLRNRFVVGAGSDSGIGYTADTSEFGFGNFRVADHGGEGKHQLSIDEMPSHNHLNGMSDDKANLFVYGGTTLGMPGMAGDVVEGESGGSRKYQGYTGNSGGNQPHNILPPYYSLAYIMKL